MNFVLNSSIFLVSVATSSSVNDISLSESSPSGAFFTEGSDGADLGDVGRDRRDCGLFGVEGAKKRIVLN